MITARKLQKSFGSGARRVVAVQDVSFDAPDGQITGLLGPNGAGKSTVLRMLYTLLRPDQGSAEVDGISTLTAPAEVRRRVGVLPDALGLYPRLTARENIRYFGQLHGLSGPALEQRITTLIHDLEMGSIADRRVEGFSQGERMKVAVGRALVHGPRNLLLDEPTNGLDVMTTRALRELLRKLRESGHCIVFSSHIMQEVAALADRIVIVAHGRVVGEGTAEELRAQTGAATLEDAFVHVIARAEQP